MGQEEERISTTTEHAFTPPWLLGLTHYNSYHTTWRAISRRLLLEPAQPWPASVAPLFQQIGLCLQEKMETDAQ